MCCIALIERQGKIRFDTRRCTLRRASFISRIFKNPLNPSIVVVPASVRTERAGGYRVLLDMGAA
jgi:hypothetical protein